MGNLVAWVVKMDALVMFEEGLPLVLVSSGIRGNGMFLIVLLAAVCFPRR